MTKVLVDSNVLVYSVHSQDPVKQDYAIKYIDDLIKQDNMIISIQNLVELSRLLLEKVVPKFNADSVSRIILILLKNVDIVSYSPQTIIRASFLSELYGLHFFDALLVATMQENNIGTVVTEDVKDFKKVQGLTVINPFES